VAPARYKGNDNFTFPVNETSSSTKDLETEPQKTDLINFETAQESSKITNNVNFRSKVEKETHELIITPSLSWFEENSDNKACSVSDESIWSYLSSCSLFLPSQTPLERTVILINTYLSLSSFLSSKPVSAFDSAPHQHQRQAHLIQNYFFLLLANYVFACATYTSLQSLAKRFCHHMDIRILSEANR